MKFNFNRIKSAIISAAEIISKLFQRHWTYWKIFFYLLNVQQCHTEHWRKTMLRVKYRYNWVPVMWLLLERVRNYNQVLYFTCNHVWNWNTIISATEIISKLFQRQWTCWKHSWPAISYWSNFEIISGKFLSAKIKLFQSDVDEGWNNFEITTHSLNDSTSTCDCTTGDDDVNVTDASSQLHSDHELSDLAVLCGPSAVFLEVLWGSMNVLCGLSRSPLRSFVVFCSPLRYLVLPEKVIVESNDNSQST